MTGKLNSLLLLLAVLYGCSRLPKEIPVTAASKHIGETVTTGGMVYRYELTNEGKATLLYIGKDAAHQELTIIIADNTEGLTISPSDTIKHPELFIKQDWTGATGQITTYQGKPAMRVNTWEDVKISKLVMDEMMSQERK